MKNKKLIIAVSIVIPLVVAVLFKVQVEGVDLRFLPKIYATINGLTALVLIMALISIKRNNPKAHEMLMKVALALSVLFLGMYVAYHMTTKPTEYGGEGWMKTVYFALLISHVLLSMAVVPLVLFSVYFALNKMFDKHKKLVKWSFPIWLYVAVSGVLVYLMISPYYV